MKRQDVERAADEELARLQAAEQEYLRRAGWKQGADQKWAPPRIVPTRYTHAQWDAVAVQRRADGER